MPEFLKNKIWWIILLIGILVIAGNFYYGGLKPVFANYYLVRAKLAAHASQPKIVFGYWLRSISINSSVVNNYPDMNSEILNIVLKSDIDDEVDQATKKTMVMIVLNYMSKMMNKHPNQLRLCKFTAQMIANAGLSNSDKQAMLNYYFLAREIFMWKCQPLAMTRPDIYSNIAKLSADMMRFQDALYYIQKAKNLNQDAQFLDDIENLIKQKQAVIRQFVNDQ